MSVGYGGGDQKCSPVSSFLISAPRDVIAFEAEVSGGGRTGLSPSLSQDKFEGGLGFSFIIGTESGELASDWW